MGCGGREGSERVKKKGCNAAVEPHFNTLHVTCSYVRIISVGSSPSSCLAICGKEEKQAPGACT